NSYVKCSGFEQCKLMAIDSVLDKDLIKNIKWYYWLNNNTLVSHAGITNQLAEKYKAPKGLKAFKKWLFKKELEANEALKQGRPHWLFMAGVARWGNQAFGGITWCDWTLEFDPIEGINQIVGHTPANKVRTESGKNTFNYCIDTHLEWYMIYEGKIKLKQYKYVK
ncbi:MAG: hypothetical protein AABY22_11350, partial [Nanoarchaeota archaeon]